MLLATLPVGATVVQVPITFLPMGLSYLGNRSSKLYPLSIRRAASRQSLLVDRVAR